MNGGARAPEPQVDVCRPSSGASGLRHGVIDPDAASAKDGLTLGHLLPGDQAHGIDHPALPDTLVAAVDNSTHWREYLCPETGGTFRPEHTNPIASLTPGRDLNPVELEATCGSVTPKLQVADLRPGDLVPLCDIDAKNKATTPVRLLTAGGHGSFHDLTYRHDDDPTEKPSSTRRKADAPVTLLARRYGALTEAETRTLLHPGATATRHDLEDVAPGTPVWFTTFRSGAYGDTDDHQGTVVSFTTESYRPAITATLPDGTRHHSIVSGHVVLYPEGALIPERVDRTGHSEQPAPSVPGSPLPPGLEVAPAQPSPHLAGP